MGKTVRFDNVHTNKRLLDSDSAFKRDKRKGKRDERRSIARDLKRNFG